MRTPDQGIRRTVASASIVLAVLAAMLVGGCGTSSSTTSIPSQSSGSAAGNGPSASALAPTHGKYSPRIDPSNFVATIDNPYWPLKPGTTFHYRGVRGTTAQTDDETVTGQTKDIIGIPSVQVTDVVSEHGKPVERTRDYYAQDKWGNVWYMGEDSFETNSQGKMVRASDSWRSGVGDAKPGIIMPADPRPGDRYRQEYYPRGEALDEASVLGLRGPFEVPYGKFDRALVTSEFSPLEPQTEQKYYVAGVGEILERVVKGHHEEFRLVRITR